MYRLSSHKFTGRRVLIIEEDDQTADVLGISVREAGGSVVGQVATIEDGLRLATPTPVDQALVHIRYTAATPLNIPDAFAARGIESVFVACHDDWFDFDDDVDGTPARMAM